MEQESNRIKIVICMGSSCFSRGNNTALRLLQDYIAAYNLEECVLFEGSLCEEACKSGPHITINGTRYDEVASSTAVDLLKFHLKKMSDTTTSEAGQR